MKKMILRTLALGCLGWMFVGCYDDKGNYDYKEINEVGIGNLGEEHSLVYKSDTLKIEPDLAYTENGTSAERYTYEWKAVPEFSNKNKGGIISTDRNLNWPVDLMPGLYYLYYKVTDEVTGLVWSENTLIDIKTEVSRGFLLIGENREGYADVNMIAMLEKDTVVVHNLLEDNGLPLLRGPRDIIHTGYTSYASDVRLWVMTDEGSYHVNTSTFEGSKENTFDKQIFTTYPIPDHNFPVDVAPRVNVEKGTQASSAARLVLCANGYVYFADLMSGDIYANPANTPSSAVGEFFKAFPKIIYAPAAWSNYMLYDEDHDSFFWASSKAVSMSTLADGDTDKFPWNQTATGRKLIYAENTRNKDGGATNGNSYAVLKDRAGQFHVYKFYVPSKLKVGYYAINQNANLKNVENFAFASDRSLMFYASGSVLYGYDLQTGRQESLDLGDEITMLKFDIQRGADHYKDLYVATYNPLTGGKLQLYTLNMDPNKIEVIPVKESCWTGLVKIKAMDWRNSIN